MNGLSQHVIERLRQSGFGFVAEWSAPSSDGQMYVISHPLCGKTRVPESHIEWFVYGFESGRHAEKRKQEKDNANISHSG